MLLRLPLHPSGGPSVEVALDPAVLDEIIATEARPTPEGRPWVTINMVASADGATQVAGVSGPLGTEADMAVFVSLRAACDVILAGSATVTAERYRPPMGNAARRARRTARGQAPLPRIAVVSNRGDIDLTLPLFADAPSDSRPILLVAGEVPAGRRAELEQVAEVLVVGDERVDLARAMSALHDIVGARMVLAEGGATLNGLLLDLDLVDEWCLTLAPLLVGGDAVRAAHSPGGGAIHAMSLVRAFEHEGELMLRYVRDRA
jgi:riboflavin biosynthesis pyrimidine reductase